MDSTKTDLAVPYRILLALSDDADAKLVAGMLTSVKSVMLCKITQVSRAKDAIEAHAADPQDLAILDFHLPDAPGIAGIDQFRREVDGLPVLFYATAASECTPSLAAQHGANDLLVRGAFDPFLLTRAVRYAAERRRSRDALRQHLDKQAHFQGVLLDLAKRGTSDPEDTFRRLCEASSRTLDVERVGVWLFNPDHTEIACRSLFTKSQGAVEAPATVIQSRDFPRYFGALEESRVVAATDARRDPRTSEFTEPYLKPLGITSMMDVPIRLHGALVGVVCHERTGSIHEWPLEEQEFGSSIADLVAVGLEAAERRRVEETLREERNFTDAVLDSTDLLMVVLDPGGRVVRFNRAAGHLTGYSAADAIGKIFWETFTAPEDAETVREIIANPPSEVSGNQHEHSWITRHGARPFIAWSITPLTGKAGALRYSVLTGIDISQRKALEEQ